MEKTKKEVIDFFLEHRKNPEVFNRTELELIYDILKLRGRQRTSIYDLLDNIVLGYSLRYGKIGSEKNPYPSVSVGIIEFYYSHLSYVYKEEDIFPPKEESTMNVRDDYATTMEENLFFGVQGKENAEEIDRQIKSGTHESLGGAGYFFGD